MKKLSIQNLRSGGIITNYFCSSRCRHCLYGCSPKWDKDFLDPSLASKIFLKIKSLGCHSVHIGGGEPFLNQEGLKHVLVEAQKQKISIEYIETNSSWFKSRDEATALLKELKTLGVSTLLVSISPFHNEFIPFSKVKAVMSVCRETGISVFPWVYEFYRHCDSFADNTPVPFERYLETFGHDYIRKITQTYWIHPGGRALRTFREVYGSKKVTDILANSSGCHELADTSHFHFDLYENYIPGLCSGIQISDNHIGTTLLPNTYPFITELYNHGVRGLYDMAVQAYGFVPKTHYSGKCHLCHSIRQFMVIDKKIKTLEFGPYQFYIETGKI